MPTPQPNILFILLDDLGWRDIGCMGSPFYETPVIDALARRGMRFTDAYAASPVCSPTRAAILSGQYPARIGVTDYIIWSGGDGAEGALRGPKNMDRLPTSHTSLAAALRDGGYATWHIGKWHLGPEECYPQHHGFDVNIGGCEWGMPKHGYFSPWDIPGLDNAAEGTYLTDHLGEAAVDLIANRDPDTPFFLNLSLYAVHTPVQGKPDLVDKYRAKAEMLGLDRAQTFAVGERFPCAHKQDQRVVRRLVQSDPAYAAMVETVDTTIGRVIDAIAAAGELDNTIIVFTSDNGGLSTAESSPTCNAPLAEGKGWMYDGGTREPLIVVAPGLTPANSTCTQPVTSPDFYPTLLELAGLPPRPEQHVDGESFVSLLRDPAARMQREAIFWHYPHYGNQGGTPGSSMRMGDYKLIEFFEDGRRELYNLRTDVAEAHDLASDCPERVATMHERLVAWRESIGAQLPTPNPDHQPWERFALR